MKSAYWSSNTRDFPEALGESLVSDSFFSADIAQDLLGKVV
jgi:hypothetical protein